MLRRHLIHVKYEWVSHLSISFRPLWGKIGLTWFEFGSRLYIYFCDVWSRAVSRWSLVLSCSSQSLHVYLYILAIDAQVPCDSSYDKAERESCHLFFHDIYLFTFYLFEKRESYNFSLIFYYLIYMRTTIG